MGDCKYAMDATRSGIEMEMAAIVVSCRTLQEMLALLRAGADAEGTAAAARRAREAVVGCIALMQGTAADEADAVIENIPSWCVRGAFE